MIILLVIVVISIIIYYYKKSKHNYHKPYQIMNSLIKNISLTEQKYVYTEKSIKILNKKTNDRYLVSMSLNCGLKEKISILTNICEKLDLPQDIKEAELIPYLNKTQSIILGSSTYTYRIYLSFKSDISPSNYQEKLNIVGIEFSPDQPRKYNIRYYNNFKKKYSELIDESNNLLSSDLAKIVNNVINLTKTKANRIPYYLRVTGKNNSRFSIDLNLIPYKIYVKDFDLQAIQNYFHLKKLKLNKNSCISHISYGKTKENNEFITLYYDSSTFVK